MKVWREHQKSENDTTSSSVDGSKYAACSNSNGSLCKSGFLHVRSDGSIQDEFFKDQPAHNELTVKDQVSDALTSGYPYSVILIYETVSNTDAGPNTFVMAAESKSTVRDATATGDDIFVSTFEMPSAQTASNDADASLARRSEIVSGSVDSNGRLFVDGGRPIKIRSVKWCLR